MYYIIKGQNIIDEWINIILPTEYCHPTTQSSTRSIYHWINIVLLMDHKFNNNILQIELLYTPHKCSIIVILSTKYHHQQYCIIEKFNIVSHHINSFSISSKQKEPDIKVFLY